MLDGEYLAPVTQRTLGQQANFGQAVDDQAARFFTGHGIEDLFGGFAQFQVGGIQQALMLLAGQLGLGRQQLAHGNSLTQRPVVRSRTLAQFLFGLR